MPDSTFDWGGTYSCSYRLMEVDRDTWEDSSEVTGVLSLSVSRDRDGELVDEGSASIAMASDEEPREFWGRIEVQVSDGVEHVRQPIATLYFVPGRWAMRRGRKVVDYSCMSVLYPASARKVLVGSSYAKGTDGSAFVVGLLRECTFAPVEVADTFALSDHVVYDGETSYLEAANMLLDAAGWCLRISERGEVEVRPRPTEAALSLDIANTRLLAPEVEADDGLEDAANRFIAAGEEGIATAVDESDRRTSFPSRGFYVDEYDSSPQLLDGETLQGYSDRKLEELNEVSGTRTYTRAFWPGVVPFDVVDGSIASVGLDCRMRVLSQNVELGAQVKVTETSEVMTS